MGVFLALTFVLAWMPALLLRHVWQGGTGPWITRLLAASALYAATMGWQPLLAALVVRRWFEHHDPLDTGVRPASRQFALLLTIAGGLPFILQDVDVGLRGTTYGPVGWIPLVAMVALVLFGRGRSAVAVPELQAAPPVASVFSLLPTRPSDRELN
jgi:hypothetical protein